MREQETHMHTLFITGAAGYVGAMLVDQFSKRSDVAKIVGLDKEPIPEFLKNTSKLVYLQKNTSDKDWEKEVAAHSPDIVIHTAWQIRELYGNRALEWRWNIDGSNRVFDFAFGAPSVRTLVYFSTVSSYGAFPDNTIEHRFTEDEVFRKTDSLYAEEKRIAEENLKERYGKARTKFAPQVFVLRPVAITGPRGRYERIRFGLQAALSGSLKGERSFWYSLVSLLVSWVPVTKKWARQYIHEDDVADIVELLAFGEREGGYKVFNIAPPGDIVLGKDMAEAVGKRALPVSPWMVRAAFFFFWHITRGHIPTAIGSWKGYSYPIVVDGTLLTKKYGYTYRWKSKDAFVKREGRYGASLPKEFR